MPRELTLPERVAVRKALAAAIALCNLAINANDDELGGAVLSVMNVRRTAAGLQGIRRDFGKVRDALAATPLDNIVVDDDDEDYAYVVPGNPYYITLGRGFFTAGHSGVDSRAGTLVHEATHWNIVRGTEDHAYEDVEALSRPLARNNAQSLERIVEDLEAKEKKKK